MWFAHAHNKYMDKKGTKIFLSLVRNGGCLKMSGNEHKTMNRAKNHARSAIISSTMYVQTAVSHELLVNKMPKCFSCPGDCKELSKRPGEAHTTRTMLGPSHG